MTNEDVQKAIDLFENCMNHQASYAFMKKEMATAITALRLTQQPFISVVDDLPTKTDNYLVHNDMAIVHEKKLDDYHNEIEIMRYSVQHKKWTTNSIVTHWMPLPGKPKGERR